MSASPRLDQAHGPVNRRLFASLEPGYDRHAMLVGRPLECARIDALLDEARAGRSGALVIRGEPGAGKTALLGYADECAGTMEVLGARGYEGEQGLPYAGLSQLLTPLERLLDVIPKPQRRALAAALRLGPAGLIDRFAAYAATLSLLAAATEERPLLAMVDDLHWLDVDSAQALVFAARRVGDDGIAIVLSARSDFDLDPRLVGLPSLTLEGLGVPATSALLADVTGRRIPGAIAERLQRATAGNPLALTELARTLSAGQLAGGEPLDDPLPGGPDLDAVFGRRIDALPADARGALVIAAADDRATIELLRAALEHADLSLEALSDAETAALVTLEPRGVGFSHPLVRSAAYHRAGAPERRAAHRALAHALAGTPDRDRRSWHLARAALGPDETVAAELEALGAEARARGAPKAAAQALEEAARLTPTGRPQTERLVSAAMYHAVAGEPDVASPLFDRALAAAADDVVLHARIQYVRAHGEFLRGSPRALQALLRAEAERVRPFDEALAVSMLMDAAYLSAPAGEARDMLRATRDIGPHVTTLSGTARMAAEWTVSLAELVAGDHAKGRRLLEDVLPAVRERPLAVPWVATAAGACLVWIEEHERGRSFLAEIVDRARRDGVALILPYALAHLAAADFRLGNWTSAYALASESVSLAEDLGQASELPHSEMRLAEVEAGRGREENCRLYAERSLRTAHELGLGAIFMLTGSALGLLELGLGRLEAAVEELEAVRRRALAVGLQGPGLAYWAENLAEAYIRLGEHGPADRTVNELERQADLTGSVLIRAAVGRCRGLSADDDEFESHFRRALALHRERAAPFEHARTRLCFGERLRRARRRTEAREQLREALTAFVALGAQPWADKAVRELHATGERARRRVPDTADHLTPQEVQVAVMAADGATNKEVAAALFISPKTVETHLNRVYRKLGVRSRVELARHLDREASDGTAPTRATR